jgi:hypothetical protein
MSRFLLLAAASSLMAAAPLGAEFRQIDLTIFGMD